MRGVNVNGLIHYADDYQEQVELGEDDFDEMAALGFNLVRLPISWSRLAPNPGEFNHHYMDEILRVIYWAKARQIYVLVDFHQDNYSRSLAPTRESDGAPQWATQTDWTYNWKMSGNPAVETAFTHFWKNRPVHGRGLQDHYLHTLQRVASALCHEPWLLAYDLLNEPEPGWVLPGYFESRYLFPFYSRAIQAMRRHDPNHCFVFEPSVIRDATNVAIQCSRPFSSDSNLIYSPHVYTETASPPFRPVGNWLKPCLWGCYAAAALEARGFGTPWVIGEFGVSPSERGDNWIRNQIHLQHQFGVGAAFWVWKQRPGFYGWGVVESDGELRTSTRRAELLAEPRAVALPGKSHRVHYDEERRALVVSGTMNRSHDAPALLYASGFAYSREPQVRVQTTEGTHTALTHLTEVVYSRKPTIRGWRIEVDLASVRGPYRIVIT
nr:cellulase family glycosylhydrolase [Sulfobacillus harzensis]